MQWSGDLSHWLLGGIISNIISIFNSSMLAAGGVKARISHNSEGTFQHFGEMKTHFLKVPHAC